MQKQLAPGKRRGVNEDIVDTGVTLRYILDMVKAHQPASVNVCALLFKTQSLKEEIEELNSDVERIVSVDLDLREVCFKEN